MGVKSPKYPDLYREVAGVNTRYWQMGDSFACTSGDRGSPLILLHGGNGSIEFWLYNIAPLAQEHRVYAFDMYGCGRSGQLVNADYSLMAQANFIRAFAQGQGLEKINLLGNSMGGGAAVTFALMFPAMLDRLILSAPLGWGQEINLGLRLLTIPGLINLLRPSRAMIPSMLKWNFANPGNLPPDWIERRYEVFALPGRQKSIAGLTRANINLWGVKPQVYQEIIDKLPQIQQQTLVLWGEADRVLPVCQAKMAARIPQHQLEVWPNCGHHPFLEFPDRFNKTVLEFLKAQ
jgi:pimeloyl-ACP methyl ester carboxylesterase